MTYITTKAFNGFGQAATQHVQLPGESGQQKVNISCPSPSTIKMIQATYGSGSTLPSTPPCLRPDLQGNRTSAFQTSCDGQNSCSELTQPSGASDPAAGCYKDFTADWQCVTPGADTSTLTTSNLPMPSAVSTFAPAPAPSSSSSLILLGGIVLALVAVVFIIIRRRKKQKTVQMASTSERKRCKK